MKIVIEQKDSRIVVNVDTGEKGANRADVANVMSMALASTVASVIPANAPSQLRTKIAAALADEVAKAVKMNFLEVVTGKSVGVATFTDKEAEFMREILGL